MANNSTWVEQVKSREFKSSSLSYAFLKKGIKDSSNIASVFEAMHVSHAMVINNTCVSQGMETTVILYSDNQSMNP